MPPSESRSEGDSSSTVALLAEVGQSSSGVVILEASTQRVQHWLLLQTKEQLVFEIARHFWTSTAAENIFEDPSAYSMIIDLVAADL